jgi:hypothetical protein
MQTLWTFGDSFTFGHGCREDCHFKPYLTYKKEGDDIWPNHLSKMLNSEVKNYGKNGASNDWIIDSIIDVINEIKENDYVVINKTHHGRFDIPYDGEFYNVLTVLERQNNILMAEDLNNFDDEKFNTLLNFQYHFAEDVLYKKRQDKKYQLLMDVLLNNKKVKTCYIWYHGDQYIVKRFETIYQHTSKKIKDWHFSFKGHKEFANYLFNTVISGNKNIL